MKKENLYEVLGDISENYVAEAHFDTKKRVRPLWLKWGTVAACFVLILAIAIGLIYHNQSYTVSLSNGSEITFTKNTQNVASFDIALVGIRALSEAESGAIFGNMVVDAYVGFSEKDNGFIYLEGTIDGFKIIVTRSDVSRCTIVEGIEATTKVNEVMVSAGYFLTGSNSKDNRTAIVYISFEAGDYTVYLETTGNESEKNDLCDALAEEALKLIETASFDFKQIQY